MKNDKAQLNSIQTFEKYVEVDSNSFVYKFLQDFPNNKAIHNNILCIYGPSGVGKTHLLNSIENRFERSKNIINVTVDQIMHDFALNLRESTMDKFRDKYYTCDFLLIDNREAIQGTGRSSLQDELSAIVSSLIYTNKHVIFSGQKHPMKLDLGNELRSYIDCSLQLGIQLPTYQMTLKITKSLFNRENFKYDTKVIDYVSKYVNGNIHKVKGILKTLYAQSEIMNKVISLEDAKRLLE